MWLVFVYFVSGIVLIDSKKCLDEEGFQVIQVCTSNSVTSGVAAISVEGLEDASTIICSCTVTVYKYADDHVPVLYFDGPGYPNCGIQIDVGGYVFTCFQGFLNLQETSYDITFRKTTINGSPGACLLFITEEPNTEVKLTCQHPDTVSTTPKLTTSKTPSPLTTNTESTTSTQITTSVAASNGTTNTMTLTSPFPRSSTENIKSPSDTTALSTTATMDMPVNTEKTIENNSRTTSTILSTVTSYHSSSSQTTLTIPVSNTISTQNSTFPLMTTSSTIGDSDVSSASQVTISRTQDNTSSSMSIDQSIVTSTKSHVITTTSQLQITESVTTPTGSRITILDSNETTTSSTRTSTFVTQPKTDPSSSTINTDTTHTSALTRPQALPTSTTDTPLDGPETTSDIGLSTSKSDASTSYVIVIAICGPLVLILATTAIILFIVRYRKRTNKTVIKNPSPPTASSSYINAFDNEERIVIDESVYFTGTPVRQRYEPMDFSSKGTQALLNDMTSRVHYPSVMQSDDRKRIFKDVPVIPKDTSLYLTRPSVKPRDDITQILPTLQSNKVFKNDQTRMTRSIEDDFFTFIPSPTETDIYAVVTKQPKALAIQPRPRLISFKGIGEPVEERGIDTTEVRRPMSQYGVLKKRESLRLVRSLSESDSQSRRKMTYNLRKPYSQNNIRIDEHIF